MKLRTLIFWPHLIAGITAGIVILVMSVTGVLLTYERQLIAWSDSQSGPVPAPGTGRLSVETLLETVRRSILTCAECGHPRFGPDAPVTMTVPQRTLYFDAYSGRLLGEGSQGMRRFMSETRAWHRWLAVEGEGRPVARSITGWSNVIFLFIVVSGFYLWFPRKWTWASPLGGPVQRQGDGQGARLQLAQRHRRLVGGPAVHRRLTAHADLVPLGERARVSRGGRGAAGGARPRRRCWWRT